MIFRIRILALLLLIVIIITSLMTGDEQEFQANHTEVTDDRIVVLLLLIDAFNIAWEDEQDLHQPNNRIIMMIIRIILTLLYLIVALPVLWGILQREYQHIQGFHLWWMQGQWQWQSIRNE